MRCKCGANAEWEWEGEFYCEDCLCIDLDIAEAAPPFRCERCGASIKGSYFTEDDNMFCSRKCAFDYYGAKKLEEEQEDNEGEKK